MPNAPTPRYNSHGRQVPDWLVVARYDGQRDVLTLSWTQDGTQHSSSSQGAQAFSWNELSAFQQALEFRTSDLHTARLF